MGTPDGEQLTILRQLYALEIRVERLEIHDGYMRESIADIQAQRAEERVALWKMLTGALLGSLGLLFLVVRPKLGL